MGPCSGCKQQRDCFVSTGMVLFKKGGIIAGRPCGSVAQVARVLARCARGPGFESRSGHVLFFPCDHCQCVGMGGPCDRSTCGSVARL